MGAKSSLGADTTPWNSISVMALLNFFAMVQFSIYFSSTYPFLLSLDPTVTERFYGSVVAAYSLGQIFGSPLFGWWANKVRNVRTPIAFGLLLSFLGNLVYLSALLVPASLAKYLILSGRFIVGFGGANVSVMRAFTSMASRPTDRSRAIALINGGYALGQTCGPAIQLLFIPLGYPGLSLFGDMFVSIFTAPAICACLVNFVSFFCLYTFFEERYAGLLETSSVVSLLICVIVKEEGKRMNYRISSNCAKKDGEKAAAADIVLPKYDLLAILLCHLTTFGQRFTFTNLETLNPPLGMLMFLWNKEEVVRYVGISHGIVSFATLLVNVLYFAVNMENFLNFRIQCILSIAGLLVFHFASFSWPFLPGALETYSQAEYELAVANGTEIVGCARERFSWCETVKPVNVWVYYASYILFVGICFPVLSITINTLFSKVLGPRRMATQQGILQMTGSLARLSGPIMISNVYSEFGPQFAWMLEFAVLGANLAMWAPLYSRMVPLKVGGDVPRIKVLPLGDIERKESVSSSSSTKSNISSITRPSYVNTQRTTLNE